MKKFLFATALIFVFVSSKSQIYQTKTGKASFDAGTGLEDISATVKSVISGFDASSGKIQFKLSIKAFEFKNALMGEHFNENYMESEKYPDSKFILTIRDEEDWFKSLFHYQNLPLPEASPRKIINAIYHHDIITNEHKDEVIELYRKYNNDVITYFTDTPEKLLIIDLCDKNKNEPDIIQKISGFTKLVIPRNFVFPHENHQNCKCNIDIAL